MKKQLVRKIFFIVLFLLISVIILLARPGGGQSYRGNSWGSGSVGMGGGDGGSFLWLLYLLPPEISIPFIILIVLFFYFRKPTNTQVISSTPTFDNFLNKILLVEREISQLKAIDHNFSKVLFLDFVSSLYIKFYEYQDNKKSFRALNPFFDQSLFNKFLSDPVRFKISEIVIGGIFIEKIFIEARLVRIYVRIKSNMTIETKGKAMRYIVDERWVLARDKNVLSPEPEKMHTLTCPQCGAPADFNDSGYCKYCGTLILPGKKQWYVIERKVFKLSMFKTESMLTYVQELGTNLPTIYAPNLENQKNKFAEIHNITWSEYEHKFINNIVIKFFDNIYKAWSELKWNKVRHLLSDRLWHSYSFWIEEYQKQGLRNIVNVKVEQVQIVEIEIDRFYEAITVRIFANGLDYVLDRNGKVLGGSNKKLRRFSEYWTFIRRLGVEKDDIDFLHCPSCGGPADKIGQTGICEYCGNKITWGDFSWILAMITQDEEYKVGDKNNIANI